MSLPKFNNKFLDSINLKFLKDLVLRFSPKYQIPNTKYLFHNSQGFALLPLIVLLLIGIAAGTLLIQNGINFLPKAAEPAVATVKSCTDPLEISKSFSHCDYKLNTVMATGLQDQGACGRAFAVYSLDSSLNPREFQYYCKLGQAQPAPATGQKVSADKLDPLHPDIPDDGKVRIQYNTQCDGNKRYWQIVKGRTLEKSGDSDCNRDGRPCIGLQNEPACPSSQCTKFKDKQDKESSYIGVCTGSSNAQPALEAGGCTKPEAESCIGFCYKDRSGNKTCTPSKENAVGCNADQQKVCTDKNRSNGCMIIRGEIKCLYSAGAECDGDDSNSCSEGCAVVQREGSWVSECKKSTCSQGYHNFCMATKNKSCEIKDGVPDCTGDPAAAPKPAAPAAAPAGGASTTGAPARTSSTANSQATSGAPSTGSTSQASSTLTSSGKPGITTEKCTSSQISNTGCSATPDRCVVDFARNGWCKYPDSEEGKACNSKHKGDCGSAECRVVNGLPRCQSTTCTEKDNTACGTNSACATASEKGFSYTYCGPKDGTSASGSSPVRSDMTNADCGYTDKDGLPIPCFKVGVFTSSDELQATKANASLASARYSQSQEILAAVKGKIDDQVFAKAQERLAAAKAAADACMKQ